MPFPPVQAEVCTAVHIVDKEKLTAYLLKKYPISILAFRPSSDPALQKLSPPRQLLANPDTCASGCTKADAANLSAINGNMSAFLAGVLAQSFRPTSAVDYREYLRGRDEDNAIQCVVDQTGKAVEAPGTLFESPAAAVSNIRIRGSPDQLYIDRSEKQEFAKTDKATIALAEDNIAGKRTSKVVLDIGYHIPTSLLDNATPGSHMDVIPYVGINRNDVSVRSGSTAKPSTSDQIVAGVLGSAFVIGQPSTMPIGHRVNARPNFLSDLQHHSRLLSLNLEYFPVLNNGLNSFQPVMRERNDFASWELIAALKSDIGHFLAQGNSSVSAMNRDYVRVGGQLGVAILSDQALVPVDGNLTYVGLYPFSGGTHVSNLKCSLTYNFDPNKYFGLTLTGSRGVREDNGLSERLWEIALSLRF
jgi:hypothetical protein